MDTAIETGIGASKTGSKKVVQKTAKATGDLIGNKIADKKTSDLIYDSFRHCIKMEYQNIMNLLSGTTEKRPKWMVLTGLCTITQKIRIKSTFSDTVCIILVVKKDWWSIKMVNINGKQSIKLKSGSIKFKSYFKN